MISTLLHTVINVACILATAWAVFRLDKARARLDSDRLYARLDAQQAWQEVVRLRARLPLEPLPPDEPQTPPGPIEAA